jgi:hypothetical protein
MKTTLTIFYLFLLSACCLGQIDKNVNKYFEFTENVILGKCNGIGRPPTAPDSEIINSGIQFKIVGTSVGGYIISILFKPGDSVFNTRLYLSSFSATTPPNPSPDIYFLLPLEIFNTKCKTRLTKNSFTIGFVTLPIKMRFGSKHKIDEIYTRNFLISSDVSLGFSIGYKRKWREDWGINFLGGFGIASVEVDSSTTKGYAPTAANTSAVTAHFGSLLENNNFQFGVFVGFDFLTGEVGKKWIYKDKPWLGVAIGYTLFKTKSSDATQ